MSGLFAWLKLLGIILVVASLWRLRAATTTSVRGLFRWHPIWEQKDDFTKAGWLMWLSGWTILVVVLFVQLLD